MVMEEEKERKPARIRGFRRPGARRPFRPRSRFRPHLEAEEEHKDEMKLEEMIKALGEGSPQKEEFEKFLKEQLGSTGPGR